MHDRLVDFERVLNFRDFGGWETADGAKVARGKLWRSAAFSDASDADIARLNAMDVRFLVDLRRPEERRHEPNKWPGETTRVFVSDEGAEGVALPPHLVALMQSDLTPKSTYDYMMSLYREIPFDPRLIKLYRDWFAELPIAALCLAWAVARISAYGREGNSLANNGQRLVKPALANTSDISSHVDPGRTGLLTGSSLSVFL